MNFTPVETKVLNRIQKDFPAVPDPLAAMADELSIPAPDFMATVSDLKTRKIIRTISGIFNADRLGYVSVLVAFSLEESGIERAALAINAHPGVSHNYLRDHRFNIWFTLASESDKQLEQAIGILAGQSGAKDYIILRNERLFKIGLMLGIGDDVRTGTDAPSGPAPKTALALRPLTVEEKETVRLLQNDLPLEPDPFIKLIRKSGSAIEPDAFIACYNNLKRDGFLRRYSAVLRHREAGYRSNAMTVWKPGDPSEMESMAKIFLESPMISHLYLRTVYPGRWEYPLFAMIHAHTDDELNNVIQELSEKSGIRDYLVLRSLREFKKERVVYFSPQFSEWEKQAVL